MIGSEDGRKKLVMEETVQQVLSWCLYGCKQPLSVMKVEHDMPSRLSGARQ